MDKRVCVSVQGNQGRSVADAALLVHFDERKPLVLAVDASPYGVGATLMHVFADGSQPLEKNEK